MGNKQFRSEKDLFNKYESILSTVPYHEILQLAPSGRVVITVDYTSWLSHYLYATLGFANDVTYRGAHESFYCQLGFVKQDLQNGHHFRVKKESRTCIVLMDEYVHRYKFDVPRMFTSGRNEREYEHQLLRSQHSLFTDHDEIRVIGYRRPLVIIQCMNYKECFVAEFYCLNIETNECVFKLSDHDPLLEQYEAYMSPNHSRVVIARGPQSRRHRPRSSFVQSHIFPSNVSFQQYNSIEVLFATRSFPGDCYTFDNSDRCRYIFRSHGKQLCKIDLQWSLQGACRVVIRRVAGQISNINKLPLPGILKSYLKYNQY